MLIRAVDPREPGKPDQHLQRNEGMLVLPVLLAAALQTVPSDTLIDVGGRRLHFEVHRGSIPVTIVLEAGGAADASSWASVPDSLMRRTGATIVSYDRASLGSSDPGPDDLTPEQEVRDLRDALEKLEVPERTIIVGTSYGAMLTLLHAGFFPDDVAGLVLVEPMNHEFIRETGDFVRNTVPNITEPRNEMERLVMRMSRTLEELTDRVGEIEPELAIPMVVVAAGEPWWGREEIDRAWRRSHETLAGRQPGRELVVAEGSDHDVPAERPDVIVEAVARVLGTVTRAE
jgi:pimeloyl-ACP methyl ester carboxylesterase